MAAMGESREERGREEKGRPTYGRNPRVSSSGDEAKGKKGSSALPGVDLMRLGDPLAVGTAREQLHIYMQTQYGKYGEFIETGNYYEGRSVQQQVDDMLEDDPEMDEDDIVFARRDIRKRKNEMRDKLESDRVAMCGDIKLILDDRGRDKLLLHADYIAIMANRSDIPLEMWRIIIEIYSSGLHGGGMVTAMDKQKARHGYANLKMKEGQSVLDYKKAFKAAVDLMEQIEAGGPDEESQAVDFLAKSDRKRYGMMLDTIRVNVDMGIQTYPTTVEMAALLMDRYHVPNAGRGESNGSVFLSGKPTAFGAATVKSEFVSEENQRKMAIYPCSKCGKLGHWYKTCPSSEGNGERSNGIAKRNGTSAMMAAMRASRVQVLDKNICVFDTGASETFGNSRLMVTEYVSMEEPLIVDTANNENLVISHKGLCGRLGEIFINETLPVTLVSARRLEEKFEIHYFQGVKYEVKVGNNKLIFAYNENIGLYVCTLDELMDIL
jgi:hypothetical protein